MKKLLFAILGIVLLTACGNKYKINGKTDVVPDGANVYLCTLEQGVNINIVDSALVDKGKFSFSGETDSCEVRLLLFAIDDDGTPFTCTIYLEPGTIDVLYNDDEVKVGGTKVNRNLQNFYDELDALADKGDEIQAKMEKADAEGQSIDSYIEEMGDLQKQYYDIVAATIYDNADNAFGMEQLLDNYTNFDFDEVDGFLNALEPKFGHTYYVRELRRMVNVQRKLAIGNEFRNFKAEAFADGKMQAVQFSDYVNANKLTMLDFWASWCNPCKDELPYLRDAYQKYRSQGFEIVSVSVDNDRDDWVAGIKANGMTWPQLIDEQNSDDCPNALYGLKTIPASYFIDSDGKIVASNLRGNELIEFLEEYFSK